MSIVLQEICFLMELSLPMKSDLVEFVLWRAGACPRAGQQAAALAGPGASASPAAPALVPAAAKSAGSCSHLLMNRERSNATCAQLVKFSL